MTSGQLNMLPSLPDFVKAIQSGEIDGCVPF